jgi:hypothetical protein
VLVLHFVRLARPMAKRWYIIHAYSNFETKVADAIREQAKHRHLDHLFDSGSSGRSRDTVWSMTTSPVCLLKTSSIGGILVIFRPKGAGDQ